MRDPIPAALLALAFASPLAARQTAPDDPYDPDPWFATFSIVAFDPATNEHGVAVASRPVGAGAAVNWAEAGIGAVATQAAANRTYGPKAMALLREGLSPEEVVKRITDEDPGRDNRQVAVIDARGRAAVFSGASVLARTRNPVDPTFTGHIIGNNFSVQGNTLAGEGVIRAMAEVYEAGTGKSMGERLMDALEAGNAAGGDVRGMGSAGILVVRPVDDAASLGRVVDLRVDHAVDPFQELRRILNMSLSGPFMRRSTELAGEGRFAEALAEQLKAVALNPLGDALQYVLAQRYAQAGEYLNALVTLSEALRLQPRYRRDAPTEPGFEKLRDFVEFRRLIGVTP